MAKTMPVVPEQILAEVKKDLEIINSVAAMVAVGTISLNQALLEVKMKTGLFIDASIIMDAATKYAASLKEEFA